MVVTTEEATMNMMQLKYVPAHTHVGGAEEGRKRERERYVSRDRLSTDWRQWPSPNPLLEASAPNGGVFFTGSQTGKPGPRLDIETRRIRTTIIDLVPLGLSSPIRPFLWRCNECHKEMSFEFVLRRDQWKF